MRVRITDNNGDWCFGNGLTDYTRDAYAVGLDIKLRLQEWYNDCFFALQKGIAWDIRLGSYNQKQLIDRDVLRIARETTGVLNIINFSSNINGREYSCSFNVIQGYSTELLDIYFNSSNN